MAAGDRRSISSFHKDHYENLYAVVSGTKTFLLLPPLEAFRLHVQRFPVCRYVPDGAGFALEPRTPEETVPWSPVDPCVPAGQRERAARDYPRLLRPRHAAALGGGAAPWGGAVPAGAVAAPRHSGQRPK